MTVPIGESTQTAPAPRLAILNGMLEEVRRLPGVSEADFAADVDAVTADLAALRALMER